jgi:hypothetical protein
VDRTEFNYGENRNETKNDEAQFAIPKLADSRVQRSPHALRRAGRSRPAERDGQTGSRGLRGPSRRQHCPSGKASSAPASRGTDRHGGESSVKNPDGSLAQHRDFENSLQDGGQFLAGLASGYMVFGGYDIALVGNACPPTALDGNTNCYIFQSGAYLNAQCSTYYACIGGLTVAANITSGQPFSIVLSGSGVVPLAGTISAVQTQDFYCYSYTGSIYVPTGANPAACTATGINGGPIVGIAGSTFTGTTLATPLAVTAGQGILVTVTISFS